MPATSRPSSASDAPGDAAASQDDARPVHRVGLVADPGTPWSLLEDIAPGLSDHLAERLPDGQRWEVHPHRASLPVSAESGMLLEAPALDLAREHDWDTLIAIVDLPRFVDGRGVVADVLPTSRIAAVCVPALGITAPRRRLRETLTRVMEHLEGLSTVAEDGELDVDKADEEGVQPHDDTSAGGMEEADLATLTPLADTEGALGPAPSEDSKDAHTATVFVKGGMGTIRLLAGMVMANRPVGLLKHMSWAIASASAAGAYGVFFGSIWTLSSVMSIPRLAVVTLLGIALLVTWLIVTNGLWTDDRERRRRSLLDNLSTVLTVGIACTLVYVGLFVGLGLIAAVIIPVEYLSQELGADAGLGSFLKLTWLATSMGTMAGAVGSNFDDTDSIRTATYSLRELDRRRMGDEAMRGARREDAEEQDRASAATTA